MRLAKALREFFSNTVVGAERIFLFLILPPLLVIVAAIIYFVAKPENHPPVAIPAAAPPVPAASAPPFEPAELLRHLAAAEKLEAEARAANTGWPAAAAAFETLAARHPENDRIWGGLGRCWLAMERYPEAKSALDRAVAKNVVEWRHVAARATVRRALGDHRGAVVDYSDALRLNPNDPFLANAMLLAALATEDNALFENKLAKLMVNGNLGAGSLVGAAAREMQQGDFQSGRRYIQQARDLIPAPILDSLLADPVFNDKRGKNFLEIALAPAPNEN